MLAERLINISCRRFLSFTVTTKPLGAFTIPLPYYLGLKVDGMTIQHTPSSVNRVSKEHFEINRRLIYEVGDELDLPHTCKLLAHPSPPALTAHNDLGSCDIGVCNTSADPTPQNLQFRRVP